MEQKVTTVSLAVKDDKYYADNALYQWNYGQILQIIDAELPMAVEVGFSTTEKQGDSDVRVGTTDNGVTTVAIPNKLFKEERSTDYSIYAFVYVTDEDSGTTVHEIVIPVKARAKQGDPSEDPTIDPSIFKDAVNAVNASANRAEAAEKSAKESAAKAKGYAESAEKSKEDVENARDNAITSIGTAKESALRGIASKTNESVLKIQRQTEESQNSIKQSIADATKKKTELDGAINNATDAKGNLDKAVQSAGNAKSELDASVGKAGEAKTALDSSISSAGEQKLALDTTIEHANTVDTSLKEHIGSAEQIQANVEQIAKNKADISSLNEDIGDLESKFDVVSESFVNKCSIIRGAAPNNFLGNKVTGIKQYFDFGKNATLTKIKANIKASNDDTAVLEIATLDGNIIATAEKAVTTEYTDVVFNLDNDIKEPVSVFVYTKESSLLSHGSYGTPYETTSFTYIFPDGTVKAAFKFGQSAVANPTTSDNKQCIVLFFDYSTKTINNISGSILQNIDSSLSKSGKAADAKIVGEKIKDIENSIDNTTLHNTLYVSTAGNDETGDGTKENPYATIYKANETITDSSETNKYEIIVKQGTYTDLQEKYSGVDGNGYQGVVCKPYVTYRSENILRPDLCVLKWDGADGYSTPVTDANCVNKCLFHIPTNSKGIYIKGFTFESKNTRYCMHIETTGSTEECDWHFENCVFSWGGRPDTAEDGTVATACIGTGYSMLEFGEFINCVIKCTNTNHANHMVFQSHDNQDNNFTSIKRGEHLRFENCYFSIADGSDYAHIDLRTTKTSSIIPSFAEFINCSGIKLYVPSETYKKSFVCTEQHTM